MHKVLIVNVTMIAAIVIRDASCACEKNSVGIAAINEYLSNCLAL